MVEHSLQRDQEDFANLYDRHKSLVFGVAKKIVKSHTIAEDITQSVFLKLWVSSRVIEPEIMTRWLAQVTRNAALDVVRSKHFSVLNIEDELAFVIAASLDTAATVVEKAHHDDVRVAVAALPASNRRPIEMAYFEGLTYGEVAERLSVPLGTVKSRIRSGLLRLYHTVLAAEDAPQRRPTAGALRSTPLKSHNPEGRATVQSITPMDETSRMAAVRRYDILDTPPDGAFDHITRIAATFFNVPISIISIVDTDRIFFKSHHGIAVEEVSRDPGLCASAILRDEPWVVRDAKIDPRTLANPLVSGELGLRFYAGAPLTTSDGHKLGTLCVIDQKPREVTPAEIEMLRDLAKIVVDELELRLSAQARFRMEQELVATLAEHKERADALIQTFQASLLPSTLPTITGLDVEAFYKPANSSQVGGDFYDIFPIEKGIWGIAIGDICGKGPQAAARTAQARYTIRTAAKFHRSPSQVLSVLNAAMFAANDEPPPLSTVCFAVWESEQPYQRGRITVANGGHPLPIVSSNEGPPATLGVPGDMLGAFDAPAFTDFTRDLGGGDAIIFYTDGLTDARIGSKPFGVEGLTSIVERNNGGGVSGLVTKIKETLSRVDVKQKDDVAIIAIQVQAAQASHC